jgi:TPR repeat protein
VALDCPTGEGCEKDIGKAIELYTKASDKGLPVARWNLAWCYHNVVKDLPKAVETYTKAADEGHPGAMWILGRFLETGDIMGRDLKRGTLILPLQLVFVLFIVRPHSFFFFALCPPFIDG